MSSTNWKVNKPLAQRVEDRMAGRALTGLAVFLIVGLLAGLLVGYFAFSSDDNEGAQPTAASRNEELESQGVISQVAQLGQAPVIHLKGTLKNASAPVDVESTFRNDRTAGDARVTAGGQIAAIHLTSDGAYLLNDHDILGVLGTTGATRGWVQLAPEHPLVSAFPNFAPSARVMETPKVDGDKAVSGKTTYTLDGATVTKISSPVVEYTTLETLDDSPIDNRIGKIEGTVDASGKYTPAAPSKR